MGRGGMGWELEWKVWGNMPANRQRQTGRHDEQHTASQNKSKHAFLPCREDRGPDPHTAWSLHNHKVNFRYKSSSSSCEVLRSYRPLDLKCSNTARQFTSRGLIANFPCHTSRPSLKNMWQKRFGRLEALKGKELLRGPANCLRVRQHRLETLCSKTQERCSSLPISA